MVIDHPGAAVQQVQQTPTLSPSLTQDVDHADASPDSRTSSWGGLQDSLGNSALAAMIAARDTCIPCYRPMADALATEGFSALLDPFGAMAREEGRQKLCDGLHVLAPGEIATGAPNEVSPEEFEHLAALYGDIRQGTCDLKIDGGSWTDGGALRDATLEDLTRIMQTKSGRTLLDGLAYDPNGHVTTILPDSLPLEAKTTAYIQDDAANGRGTDADVDYAAGQEVDANNMNWGKFRSDVALFHELTHAWHDARGDLATGTVGTHTHALRDMLTVANWEHQAVGLDDWADAPVSENAYRRERAALGNDGVGLPDDEGMAQRWTYK